MNSLLFWMVAAAAAASPAACDPFTSGLAQPVGDAGVDGNGGITSDGGDDSGDSGLAPPTGPAPVTVVAADQGNVTSLLVTNGFLYWTDESSKTIKRASIVDDADNTLVTPEVFLATNTVPHALFSRGNGKVAWAQDEGIYERADSSATISFFVKTEGVPADFTITSVGSSASTRTWWIEATSEKVISALNNDPQIAKESANSPFAIVAAPSTGERVYWTKGNGEIRTSNGGTVDTVSENETDCQSIAITSKFVYWARPANGLIRRAPIDVTGDASDFVTTEDRPFSLVTYAPTGDVYWLTMNGTLRMATEATGGAGVIVKANDLRQESPFAHVTPHARNIAITDKYVYFVSWLDKKILRTKRN